MKKIIFDFNKPNKWQKDFKEFQESYNKAIELSAEDLKDKLNDKLNQNMAKYRVFNQDVRAKTGVYIDKNTDEYKLVVDSTSNITPFIEYGVGIVGSRNPHPKASEFGWEYDINNHGEAGWLFPITDNYAYIPEYIIYINGKPFYHTRGHSAYPFMYETWLYGRRIANNVIRKYIRSAK